MMRPVTAKMRTAPGTLRPPPAVRPATMTYAETSVGVPHTCHEEGTTPVVSSHPKALQTVAGYIEVSADCEVSS